MFSTLSIKEIIIKALSNLLPVYALNLVTSKILSHSTELIPLMFEATSLGEINLSFAKGSCVL